MTDRQITTLREIIGRIHRRTTVKPDMSLISLLAKEADEILKKGQSLPIQNVSISEIQAYAEFCVELDRQGMKPLTWDSYLEIG